MALRTSRGKKRPLIALRPERRLALILGALLFVASSILFAIESHRVPSVSSAPRPSALAPLRVWFLNIGQGDSTFIETPDGHQILIDGGVDNDVLAKLGQIMPPWDRTIDVVVATHPDADHIGGLAEVIERYEVATIMDNGDAKDTTIMDEFLAARDQEPGVEQKKIRVGDEIVFGDVTFKAVWPTEESIDGEDSNASSIVFLVTYGETSVLVTGDATAEAERSFADEVGDLDVLRTGHHGSNTSTTEFLLDTLTPEIAIISCGVKNRYGHPHPAVLSRLFERDIRVLRTDLDGDVLLTSMGGEPTVEPAPLPF